MGHPETAEIRAAFPALAGGTIYFDNAGGTQVPRVVIEAVRRYMVESYVQTSADYEASRRATATAKHARDTCRAFLNAGGVGEVVMGASTSQQLIYLANAYAEAKEAGRLAGRDEIVVAGFGHEANVTPWRRLARRGFSIREWAIDRDAAGLARPSMAALGSMVSERTLLVAFPQVSNVLGECWDVRAVTETAHRVGARVVIDGVAYAPHHAPDVGAWGCDWYVWAPYKVFGPHMGVMFGRFDAFADVSGPNHDFVPRESPAKWEPGGVPHENAAGLGALWAYACFLAGRPEQAWLPPNHATFAAALRHAAGLERSLTERLLAFLRERGDVAIVGSPIVDEDRVCLVSFTSARRTPEELSIALGERGIGVRRGDCYSPGLCRSLGLERGVLRVSMSHYNTMEELGRLEEALGEML